MNGIEQVRDIIRKEVEPLAALASSLKMELEQTRADVNYLIENSIDTPNIYLKPKELATLVGCSHSTIKRGASSKLFIALNKSNISSNSIFNYC